MEQDLYLEELAAKIERQRAKIRALELEAEKRKQSEERRQSEERYRNEQLAEDRRQAKLRETAQKRELFYQQEEQRYKDRQAQEESAMQAHLRHKAIAPAQRLQQKSVTEERILGWEGPVPSFLEAEYLYMRQASATFPEEIPPIYPDVVYERLPEGYIRSLKAPTLWTMRWVVPRKRSG